ncbi:outer membrane protein assembly factor BamE [Thioalkalivibrio sp. XN279]|uniref:outer membrane protein assembly factor BamE n=1 Tax=Thioalkalivibrio sp. XN279 TaxID=2714953 RepID=UPI00140C4D28|nr:outer membrane protein assembly factor BamE [Thioalkalivibrio sp. XN279]NHA14587.1 outer membrane protein assembly factor BamE [Thioalkalivibrio sp. XN279]
MTQLPRLFLLLAIALLGGCSALQGFSLKPYRMNIQQGNYLEAEAVDQLEVGMTESQVRFLIGTPMIADPFNADRWDYVFFFKVGRTRNEVVSRLTVWFEDGRVVRIDRPESLEDAEEARPEFDA